MSAKREDVVTSAEERIGPELKRLREEAGLSVRTLAERAGFSASFISQLENLASAMVWR
jgi:transcriptional regulator with XRE-family HTH domain